MKEELQKMYLSPIRDISIRSAQLADQGADVISFGAGDSDFDTPGPIKEAAVRAIQRNRSHYETIWGNDILREKIREDYKSRCQLNYKMEEVLITAAGTESIFDCFLALIAPGDEVIVISPAFINYENCITLAGGKTIFVPVKEENGFEPDITDIEAAITDRTKMVVINNPCNPTGVVYSDQCLEELSALAVQHDLLVFSDEVYDKIVYDGVQYRSIAQFPGMKERTIIANSFSKVFAMTGYRIGYLLAEEGMMEQLYLLHHYSTACQPTFIQDALAETIDIPEVKKLQQEMTETFHRRRDIVREWLMGQPLLTSVTPKGAFYYFINVSGLGMTGREFSRHLLEDKLVAVVPGEGLGKEFSDYIRLSYAVNEERLKEGLERISCFLKQRGFV